MGSAIKKNDTLKLDTSQGFPSELDFAIHQKKNIDVENFRDKVFTFKNLKDIRLYPQPPINTLLVQYTANGKWLYWGLCHILEITHDYVNQTTSGKFKIVHINTVEDMKKMFRLRDRIWANDYFEQNT